MKKETESGVYIDLDKDFYKKVRIFCFKNGLRVKDFVKMAMEHLMKDKRWKES